MNPGAVHRVRDPAGISDDRETGHRKGREIVSVRDRPGDRLRAPRDVDAISPTESQGGRMSVDWTARPDVRRFSLREDPGVAALVRLAYEQEEEVRIQVGHVFAAESILVGDDLLELPNESGLARDETRGSVRTNDEARVDGVAIRLDPPGAIVLGQTRDPRRRSQLGAIVHGLLHDPTVERGPVDRVSGQAGDVEPLPIRGDALGTGDALRDPFIPRAESVRQEAELAHS